MRRHVKAGMPGRASVCMATLAALALLAVLAAPAAMAAPGDEVWSTFFGETTGLETRAVDSATGPGPSLYVLAQAEGTLPGAPGTVLLIKYAAAGGPPLWSVTVAAGSNVSGASVVVDDSGYAVVCGTRLDFDAFVAKYGPGGGRRWIRGFGTPGFDDAADVAVARDGSVYLAATTLGSAHRECTVIKWNARGSRKWVRRYTGPGGPSSAAAVALDRRGNVYVAGSVAGAGAQLDGLVMRLTPTGAAPWWRRWAGKAGRDDRFVDVAVSDSKVFACGSQGTRRGSDALVIAYGSGGGNRVWGATVGFAGDGDSSWRSAAVTPTGGVAVAGSLAGVSLGSQSALGAYRSGGSVAWRRLFNLDSGPMDDELVDVAVDPTGRVFAVGRSETSVGADMVTVSYGAGGAFRWRAVYDGGHDDAGAAVALRGTSAVYSVGLATGDSAPERAVIVRHVP